ncbi:MAG: caa(3)-type oxidase subunit IV [Planctomycetes bacterium]|jgi:caa(3)-type oxidase subunit IV|nr:caa(3)-type oxidase subunit IV [Planctomycetota bacterium]|tara:strand:- start:124 stop:483 length:360 start_codon:yes stop_codon:yes gene_type:complete
MSDNEDHHEHPDYKKIYYVLLALLIVSIFGPELVKNFENRILVVTVVLITAFVVAIIKAGMVAAWFMHMDIEKKIVWYLMAIVLLCMLVFFAGVAPDVLNTEGDNWEHTRTVDKIPGQQ